MARRRGNRRRYRRRRLRRYHRRKLRQQDEQRLKYFYYFFFFLKINFQDFRSLIAEAGTDPIWATCPNCDEEILTTIEKSVSRYQCLIASGLIASIFGFICCFWMIPYCMDDWKDVLHTCPNCNYEIGKYEKIKSKQGRLEYMIWATRADKNNLPIGPIY